MPVAWGVRPHGQPEPEKGRKILTSTTRTVAAGLLCLVSTVATDTTWGQKVKDPGYKTTWVRVHEAYPKAEESRYGILFYFPGEDEAEHEIFSTEEMTIQSTKSPMVKVARDQAELRALYEVPEKHATFVVTDWYGNFMQRWVARSATDRRIKFEAIRQVIKDALPFADAQNARLEKGLEKAKKAHENEKWSTALKELEPLTKLAGYKRAGDARDLRDEIIGIGMDAIERLDVQPPSDRDDHVKQLKKIARDFPTEKIEKATEERIAKLEAGG